MASRVCITCGGKIGAFSEWQLAKDGCLCQRCYELIKEYRSNACDLSKADLLSAYEKTRKNEDAVNSFKETSHIGNKLGYVALFDDDSETALLPKRVCPVFNDQHFWAFSYDEIVSAELYRNAQRVQVNGLARAAFGAALFGVAGAVAGMASAQDAQQEKVSDSIEVEVTVKNYPTDTYKVVVLSGGLKEDDSKNVTFLEYAVELVSKLNEISGHAEPEVEEDKPRQIGDPADEIRKYKLLFDEGIITKEEFDAKKKQLLGL